MNAVTLVLQSGLSLSVEPQEDINVRRAAHICHMRDLQEAKANAHLLFLASNNFNTRAIRN